MNVPLLQANNLSRRYGSVEAVSELSFSVDRGEVLGLLGLNGAGKSSTLTMLSGVRAPDQGDVLIDGHSIIQEPMLAKSKLGFLPETAPLYPDMKVSDYLRFAAKLRRVRRKLIKSRVDDLISELGLEAHARRTIGNLSKGYKQRVGIAQALIHHPQLVILDEPGSGLDPEQMREMRELIRALGRTRGVIFSSHLLPEINETCHRVVVLHNGRKRYEGTIPGSVERTLSADDVSFLDQTLQMEAGGVPSIDSDATAAISTKPRIYSVKLARENALKELSSFAKNHAIVEHVETGASGNWLLHATVSPQDLLQILISSGLPVSEFKVHEQTLETLFSELVNSSDSAGDIPTLNTKVSSPAKPPADIGEPA